MTGLHAQLVAGLLALATSPQAQPAPAPAAAPIEVQHAETVRYDAERHRVLASGEVVLRRGVVVLRARAVSYDPETGEAEATGSVMLSEPGRVVGADSMHLVLDGPFEAKDVTAFYKDKPLDLASATSLDAARGAGRNRMTLTGARISGNQGESRLSIEKARIALCDCPKGPPSWEIRASHADVIPGKRAILTWPVIYITPRFLFIDKQVPVFIAPWLYLPLAERQTGLLMPAIDSGPASRLILAEPVFFDLGRSYDATLTPQWVIGKSAADVKAGLRSVEGPGANLQVRWAPAQGTDGRLELRWLHDLARTHVGDAVSPEHGDRLGITLLHDQRISDAAHFHAEVGLVSDPLFVSDFTADWLLRDIEYSRSSLTWTRRFEGALLEADAAYHLPLKNLGANRDFPVDPTSQAPRFPYGLFGTNVPIFHRLPSASASFLPMRLAGPLFLSASAGIARFAPIKGSTGDEGQGGVGPGERLWSGPLAPGAPPPAGQADRTGQLDGRWERGERLAALREAMRLELRAPFSAGRILSIEPWVSGTATAYQFQTALPAQGNLRAAGGLVLSSVLERSYGPDGKRRRHTVEPRLEWRAGTGIIGPGLPAYAYDELDVAPGEGQPPTPPTSLPIRPFSALPGGRFDQLRASLRSRLSLPGSAASQVELEVGQDFDLDAGRRSETFVNGSCAISPVRFGVGSRFRAFGAQAPEGTPAPPSSSWLDKFTQLTADVTISDTRGDNLHGNLLAIGSGGSPQLKAGLEPLFDPRPVLMSPVATAVAGATVRLSGLTASYDLSFAPRADAAGSAGLRQHVWSLLWDSPCHCWRAGLTLVLPIVPAGQSIQPHFVIDLGSAASGAFSQ